MRSLNPRILLAVFVLAFSAASGMAHPGHYHPPVEVDEFEEDAFMSTAAFVALLAAGGFFLFGYRTARGRPATVRILRG